MSWPIDAGLGEASANRALDTKAEALLELRRKQYDAPELPYQPIFNRILVMRFPPEETETKTAGGLIIPQTAQKLNFPQQRGLLLAAGNAALTTLRANGIRLGDIVYWGAYEGEEREFKKEDSAQQSADPKRLLQLKDSAIMGSEDLLERIGTELCRVFVQDPSNPDDAGDYIFKAVRA